MASWNPKLERISLEYLEAIIGARVERGSGSLASKARD